MYSIFGIKTRPINEIETTTNDISISKGGTISLTCARTTETVTIVSMVSVALFVPTWQPVKNIWKNVDKNIWQNFDLFMLTP